MKIGIPKEIKVHEYRIGATPSMVSALTAAGHEVVVETGGALRIGFTDEMFKEAGAKIVPDAKSAYDSEMVIKVKEPIEEEYDYFHDGQILFCFLHLAPNRSLTQFLVDKNIVAVAYETVTDRNGQLPLLHPMSEIAGRVSVQVGAAALQMNHGGKGLLLGGVPGVPPARVVVIGGGVVGTEAARMAMGLGAEVWIIDKNIMRLRELDLLFDGRIKTLYSTDLTIRESVIAADLVVGSVLIPGKSAPKLVTKQMIQKMSPGSVIVDVAIDQGGCMETSKPTTHAEPTYIEDGIVHYCVTNMPGACARTATQALTNATLDYAIHIANKGYRVALYEDVHLRNGLNVCAGQVTNEHVAHDLGFEFHLPEQTI